MRIALIQLNPLLGDLDGNAARLERAVRAIPGAVDLCVTPELSLTGYPPRDLLLQPSFLAQTEQVLKGLAARLRDTAPVLVGAPIRSPKRTGRGVLNAAVLLDRGRVAGTFAKTLLPDYDVFDESRYFEPGDGIGVAEIAGRRVAVSICEDAWNDREFWRTRRYHRDPVEEVARTRIDLLVNLSASPFAAGKQPLREAMLGSLARRHAFPVAYVNQAGAHDDLIFDGRSMIVDREGRLVARAGAFVEETLVADTDLLRPAIEGTPAAPEAEIFQALVTGTRDYARKSGFRQALLGLSGGIDSALTAVVAARALGAEHVRGVLLPSPWSSSGSVGDSLDLASRLGIETESLPIAPVMQACDGALAAAFAGRAPDVTEENLQARLRGLLLMALANKRGALLLTTGNKSELAVGYCTLYGDMCGGLAVLADLTKTMVYRVARWVNRGRMLIPPAIVEKAPSAELRPGQTDQDSLPPYPVLDAILERHLERHETLEDIVAAGFDPAVVRDVLRLVRRAEFKRKQAAPGLRVTNRAFGPGWRMPIVRGDWESHLTIEACAATEARAS